MLPRFLKNYLISLADVYEKDARWDAKFGKTERAAGTMRLAARLGPTPERYLWLAEMLEQLGDLQGAKKAIVRSIHLYGDRETFDVHFISGILSSKLGDVGAAIEEIKKARSLDPNHPLGIYALGSLYATQGEFAKANDLFAKDAPVATGNGELTYTRAFRFSDETIAQERQAKSKIQDPDARRDHFLTIFRTEFAESQKRERQAMIDRVTSSVRIQRST